jgi:hypothetical protein
VVSDTPDLKDGDAMKLNRLLLAGIVLGGPLWFAFALDAHAQNTAAVGGRGGTSFSIRCPADKILTGIKVDAGMWVDRITPSCAFPTSIADGGWDVNGYLSKSAGKWHLGNREQRAGCSQGYAVKGFTVKSGNYVDSIAVSCAKLGRSWRTTSTTKTLSAVGGGGGTSQPAKACSGDMLAVGIHGKAGEYVDSFGLICGSIMPVAPVPQAPVSGLRVSTLRPTFYWTPAKKALGKYTLCVNLTAGAPCSAPGTFKTEVDSMSTSWTPPADLPFRRGERVYWGMSACNDNGCRSKSAYFIP